MPKLQFAGDKLIGQGFSVKEEKDGTRTLKVLAPSRAKTKARAKRRAANKNAKASRQRNR